MKRLVITFVLLSAISAVNFGAEEAVTESIYKVDLLPRPQNGLPDFWVRPDCSGKCSGVALTAAKFDNLTGFDHLQATLPLREENPQKIVVARSKKDGPYDTIILDRNLDGEFTDEQPQIKQPTRSSSGNLVRIKSRLMSPRVRKENIPEEGDYPTTIQLVMKDLSSAPEKVQWFGTMMRVGEVTIDQTEYEIIVWDMNNDAALGQYDYWKIVLKDPEADKKWPNCRSRRVGDFNWAGGKAWKIELLGEDGIALKVREFDPGVTQEADENSRDFWFEDKKQQKSSTPLAIQYDYNAVQIQAKEDKKNVILKFETSWCGPCRSMKSFVLSQKQVVQASKNYLWVKVDGDDQKELVERYDVKAYPTFVVLDSEGRELKRFHRIKGNQLVQILNSYEGKQGEGSIPDHGPVEQSSPLN